MHEEFLVKLLKFPNAFDESTVAKKLNLELDEARYILDLARRLSLECIEQISLEKLRSALLAIEFLRDPREELLRDLLKKKEVRRIVCETIISFYNSCMDLNKVVKVIRSLLKSRDLEVKWYCSVLLNFIYARVSDSRIKEEIRRIRSRLPLIKEMLGSCCVFEREKTIKERIRKDLLNVMS